MRQPPTHGGSVKLLTMSLLAVVFDFDGLIVDTETAVFEATSTMLRAMGYHLGVDQWAGVVGRGEDDSWDALCALVGCEIDRAT